MLATSTAANKGVLTVGDLLDYLSPGLSGPDWPPDVFALVVALLQKSGAYTRVVGEWPPSSHPPTWCATTVDIGKRWREALIRELPAPTEILEWWQVVIHHRALPVSGVGGVDELWRALLQLCAVADEAARGAGIPSVVEADDDSFDQKATKLLLTRNTLCVQVDPSRACVLPKLHTPQNGMTIRSLSHNLALCSAGDVRANWFRLAARRMNRSLNLLIVPWPWTIQPAQFKQAPGSIANLPKDFGFFDYVPDGARFPKDLLEALFRDAEAVVGEGQVDCVIFPESSLTPESHEDLRKVVCELHKAVLIAGISDPAAHTNYLTMEVPTADGRVVRVGPQHKHHRWRLEKSQILQYGLGSSLDPAKSLWERIPLSARELYFVSARPWLTLCTLICEDLARQDPVADILRSVAPNLLITLLMDGPQLISRWSARYATVFADDPGCSVLTLTSLGMASLSRPRGASPSRSIALWKDAQSGGPVQIEMPFDAKAMILSLAIELRDEWTADGRGDYGSTGYPILAGVYPIRGGLAVT